MILITGASGTIGRAVVEQFIAQGAALRVQVRSRPAFLSLMSGRMSPSQVEIREMDFTTTSERDLRSLAEGCATIIHNAGLVHLPEADFKEYEFLNVRLTQQLAEVAAQAGTRTFLFPSTIAVYGSGPFENIEEDGPQTPITPYAVSKAASERWLKAFTGIPRLIVLRPALVFGEGDRGNLLKLIQQIERGKYFQIGSGSARKSLIYAKDLAQAMELCIDKLPDGFHVFNASNPQPVELRELTSEISRCLGGSGKLPSLPESLVRLGAKVATKLLGAGSPLTMDQIEKLTTSTTCSVEQLVRATGFSPKHSLSEGLSAEIAWAKQSGLLA